VGEIGAPWLAVLRAAFALPLGTNAPFDKVAGKQVLNGTSAAERNFRPERTRYPELDGRGLAVFMSSISAKVHNWYDFFGPHLANSESPGWFRISNCGESRIGPKLIR